MHHCVDDMLLLERLQTADTAWYSWRALAAASGWDIKDQKSLMPSQKYRALGISVDLRNVPVGPAMFHIEDDRRIQLQNLIQDALRRGQLAGGLAGQMWGKLGFATSQTWGRVGRSMLRAFSRRQHEPQRKKLNLQLRESLEWWLNFLEAPISREIPLNPMAVTRLVSYSDGEGADAGIGVALWSPDWPGPKAGYMRIPPWLRAAWRKQREQGMLCRDIYEIEGVAPALILHAWGQHMTGCMWLHFIDHEGAQATLIRGSSSVHSGDAIAGWIWSRVAALKIYPWFERVASPSNPVDKLSRGRFDGPWRAVEPLSLPPELEAKLRRSAMS